MQELDILVENIYRLKFKLFKAGIVLLIDYESHVPDLMTRIRALPGFAVVGQTEKVERVHGGSGRVGLSIKYLPNSNDIHENLKLMSEAIKTIPGVQKIKIETYNKRPILKNGQVIFY